MSIKYVINNMHYHEVMPFPDTKDKTVVSSTNSNISKCEIKAIYSAIIFCDIFYNDLFKFQR